jgi:hypothetical protein
MPCRSRAAALSIGRSRKINRTRRKHREQRRRSASVTRHKARLTDSIADRDRRAFLRLAVAQGVAAPVALAVLDGEAIAAEPDPAGPTPAAKNRKGAMRLSAATPGEQHAAGAIVRDFADPYLELLRLLREAAEVEHALMLQYLYCAFSLREPYSDLAGYGEATAESMIGVAIQEMQHLSAVNRLLVALGSCPHLDRQDFPYEPDIYPFVFQLEPLSKPALAKYVFTEAPAEALALELATDAEDRAFRESIHDMLGTEQRTNHVGSLYRSVLDVLGEVAAMPDAPITAADAARWQEDLRRIMDEGEDDHFKFFRNTFEARLEVFGQDREAWSRTPEDPRYPAHAVGLNPTAYIGHPNQIAEPSGLLLGWLGDLHYWMALSTLDYGYRMNDDVAVDHAVVQMTATIWPLAQELPRHRTGLPFDPLSMGYALGANPTQTRRIIASFGKEALAFARHVEHRLPEGYDTSATEELIRLLQA